MHFTIKARITTEEKKDNTNGFTEGFLPVAGFALFAGGAIASGALAAGALATGAAFTGVAAAATNEYAMGAVSTGSGLMAQFIKCPPLKSDGWYAGYDHKLEIHVGDDNRFYIRDTKRGINYY